MLTWISPPWPSREFIPGTNRFKAGLKQQKFTDRPQNRLYCQLEHWNNKWCIFASISFTYCKPSSYLWPTVAMETKQQLLRSSAVVKCTTPNGLQMKLHCWRCFLKLPYADFKTVTTEARIFTNRNAEIFSDVCCCLTLKCGYFNYLKRNFARLFDCN